MSAIDPVPHQQEGYDFMAAPFEVYNEIGSGFLAEVYQESLELELTERKIPFVTHPSSHCITKGNRSRSNMRQI